MNREIKPVSLDIKLDVLDIKNIRDRARLEEELKQEDGLSLLARFKGQFTFSIGNRNILQTKKGGYETAPLVLLYWFLSNQGYFIDPDDYRLKAPERYLELRRATNSPPLTPENEELEAWAEKHVLAGHRTLPPYITIQAPNINVLEVTWNFKDQPQLVSREGNEFIPLDKFLDQIRGLGGNYEARLRCAFPGIGKKSIFEQIRSYALGDP